MKKKKRKQEREATEEQYRAIANDGVAESETIVCLVSSGERHGDGDSGEHDISGYWDNSSPKSAPVKKSFAQCARVGCKASDFQERGCPSPPATAPAQFLENYTDIDHSSYPSAPDTHRQRDNWKGVLRLTSVRHLATF